MKVEQATTKNFLDLIGNTPLLDISFLTRFTLKGRGAKHLFILAVVIIMLTSCFNLNYVTERHEHYTTSGRVEDIDVSVAS